MDNTKKYQVEEAVGSIDVVNKGLAKSKFGFRDLFGYFMGDFGSNMSFALISGYMFVFYTQFVGIKLSHYALIILLTKILDGINDPIVGVLIDKFTPKNRDKFRPLILMFSPVLSVSAALMFVNSSGFSYPVKLAMCVGTYILWDICYTLVNVPYGAMASVITRNSNQRAQLSTARSFGSVVGGTLINFTLPLFLYTTVVSNGSSVSVFAGERAFPAAVILGIIAIVAFLLCYKYSTERVKPQETDIENDSQRISYLKAVKTFFTNRAMLGITVAGLGQILFIMSGAQLSQLTYQIYFNDGRLNAYGAFIQLIPIIFGLFFGNSIVKRIGTKNAIAFPMIGTIIIYIGMLVFPITNPMIWLGLQIIAQVCSFGLAIYLWGLVADAIDYQEFLSGERNEGITYSTYTMLRKMAQGVGSALVPMLIAMAAPGLVLSQSSTWLPEYAATVKNLSIIFPLLGTIVAFVGIHFINNLTPEKMIEINVKRAERDAKN